jgi:NitT/TauT family transport system permease protein
MALDQGIGQGSNRFVKAKIAKLLPGQAIGHGNREQDAVGGSGDEAMSGVADRSRISDRFSLRVLSILTLVAIWKIASLFLSETILPGPWPVVQTMYDNLNAAKSYIDIGATIYRVFAGIMIATIGGLVLGLMMGLSRRAEYFFDSWVLVGLTIPAVVYGIVGILWFGLNSTAAIIAIAMTAIPAVALNIWQGVKAIDMSLVHMARAFRFPALAILRLVIIPQILPFLLAAFRYALGIGWKTATIVEVIGLSTGVGYELNYWFGFFNMRQVFAWTLTFTAVLLLFEFLILKPVEWYLTRWRSEVQVA